MILSNREFHKAIAAASKNALLAESYHRLLDVGMRVARFTLNRPSSGETRQTSQFVDDTVADHSEMIDAITRGDADEAERLAVLHTERTRQRFQDYLQASDQRLSIPDPAAPLL